MSTITISEKHGINPAIPKCFYCLQDKNEIILAGKLRGDAEAPRNAVWDLSPCSDCQDLMAQGIILISVKDGEMERIEQDLAAKRKIYEETHRSDRARRRDPFVFMPNPYRTGGWIVVTDEYLRDIVSDDSASVRDNILRHRWAFIPDEVWDAIGFPRE